MIETLEILVPTSSGTVCLSIYVFPILTQPIASFNCGTNGVLDVLMRYSRTWCTSIMSLTFKKCILHFSSIIAMLSRIMHCDFRSRGFAPIIGNVITLIIESDQIVRYHVLSFWINLFIFPKVATLPDHAVRVVYRFIPYVEQTEELRVGKTLIA